MSQPPYEAIVARHNAAFAAFKAIYEQKSPPPVLAPPEHDERWVRFGLLAMVIASVIVSGSHTIPTFVASVHPTDSEPSGLMALVLVLVAVAAFVMIELSIIIYAYIRTRNHYRLNPDKPAQIKHLLALGFGFALTIAIAANVHSSLKSNGFASDGGLWRAFSFLITLGVGASAPVLAFISGDILGMLSVVESQRRRKAQRQYEQALVEWNEGLLRSWNAQKSRWGADIQVEQPQFTVRSAVHSLNGANEQEDEPRSLNRSVNAANGYTKQMNARDVIAEWFEQHPDQLNDRLDRLVDLIHQDTGVKVGRTSIHNVRRELMREQGADD